MSQLRRAFSLRHLGVTVSALSAMLGAIVLAVTRIAGRLSTDEAITAILAVLAVVAFSEGFLRIVSIVRIEDELMSIGRSLSGDSSGLSQLKELTPTDHLLVDATDVLMVGLTKVAFLSQRVNYIRMLVSGGCSVRILILDPDVDGLYSTVARNLAVSEERFRSDVQQTFLTIETIREGLTSDESSRLQVRLSNGSPGVGVYLVNSGRTSGLVQVYFFSYRADPAERPALEFRRSSDPEWYEYFRSSYEKQWTDSVAAS